MRHVSLLVLWLAFTACGGERQPETPRFCTEVGCAGGLNVTFSRRPLAPFRVEAHTGEAPVRRAECPGTSRGCLGGVHFEELVADSVELRFITATDTFAQVVRPRYALRHPNGPECPPFDCRVAYVGVTLPAEW